MTNRLSQGHILIVRRQSYIPSYFSVYESQLPLDKEDAYKLETAETLPPNRRFYLLCTGNSAPENCFDAGYLTFPLRKSAEHQMDSEIHTTRLLSSGLAQRFSCNVSKMAYRMRSRMVCDGYFGCPDEPVSSGKENVPSLRRGKPVCILPWKKRHKASKVKKKHSSSSKTCKTHGPAPTLKVDCVTSSLERTKVSGIKAKSHVSRSQQGTMSHPAMFYSYYIAKGNALPFRKICAPKRRTCDGYFGCYEEESLRGKKAGKRKPLPKY